MTGPVNNNSPIFNYSWASPGAESLYATIGRMIAADPQLNAIVSSLLQSQANYTTSRPLEFTANPLREIFDNTTPLPIPSAPPEWEVSQQPASSTSTRPSAPPRHEVESSDGRDPVARPEADVPDPALPNSPTPRNPASSTQQQAWNQPILQFLFNQLQQAVAQLYQFVSQNPTDQEAFQLQQTINPRIAGKALQQFEQAEQAIIANQRAGLEGKESNRTIEQRTVAQESVRFVGQQLTQINQTIGQNSRPIALSQETAQQAQAQSKMLLADMALKLLSVNQLAQMLVAPGAKQELSGNFAKEAANLFIATQIGQMLSNLEQLKTNMQKQPDGQTAKFYQIIATRLAEVLAASQELNQASPQQKQELLQRLSQESEWLATMVAASKSQADKTNKPSTTTTTSAAAMAAANAQKPGVNPATVVPQQGTQPAGAKPPAQVLAKPGEAGFMTNQHTARVDTSSASQSTNTMAFLTDPNRPPVPMIPLMPRGPQELAGMIQMHLSRGVMQPLPLIVPYPISIELFDVRGANSAEGEKARNDEREQRKIYGGSKDLSQVMILIPPGPVIVGDPFNEGRLDERPTRIEQLDAFLIASTPVTNAQFAAWLSDALLLKKIQVIHPGKIFDGQGRLLAMTIEGAPLSQIEITNERGILEFRAIPGKSEHPVVHVTYDGALAYCEANGLRLPTEPEWERAAGMMPTEYGQPLKKLPYACSVETLSPTWALYKDNEVKAPLNLSMPVGFFDGQKVYTKSGQTFRTNLSVSPWGCSDMSGNVREWTSDSYDEDGLFQITKGGSYGDTAFDLRVAAKIPLPPSHSDPYTGFRVAL